MKQPGVYILKSEKNGRYYIGSTNRLEERIKEHNAGYVKATKYITPLSLKKYIVCESLSEARKAEARLKKYKNRDILNKMIDSGIFPWEYKGP